MDINDIKKMLLEIQQSPMPLTNIIDYPSRMSTPLRPEYFTKLEHILNDIRYNILPLSKEHKITESTRELVRTLMDIIDEEDCITKADKTDIKEFFSRILWIETYTNQERHIMNRLRNIYKDKIREKRDDG